MRHNTWNDQRIAGHPFVNADDPAIRVAAEMIHRNESLHRHDPSGMVCVYCAINASLAVRAVRGYDGQLAELVAPLADRED